MKPTLVFTYGTLKRGYGNNRLLDGARFMGEAVTQPIFNLFSLGGFPGITMDGTTAVHGEVFEVTDETMMARLDRLEGHPGWYRRTPIKAHYVEGGSTSENEIDVEAYVLPDGYGAANTQIPSGIWGRRSAA